MKGGTAVVGERDRATVDRVTRVLGIAVGRSSSEDVMFDILSKGEEGRRRRSGSKSTEIDGNRRRVRKSKRRRLRC